MSYAQISFVILTWNSEKYIDNCLKSIFDMKNIEKEVFVVDNGSTDSTRSIIEKYNVNTIFLDKNMGTTYPRNLAIKQRNKNFEFLCVLDSDTQINEKAFINMIDILRSDSEFAMAGPVMYNKNNELQITAKRFPTFQIKLFKAIPLKSIQKIGVQLERYDFDNHAEYSEVDHIISACWLIKNTAAEKTGLLDEKIFYAPEDNDYCMRMRKNGYKIVFVHKSKIIHDTQRISHKKIFSYINYMHIKGLIYYFFKHKYLFKAPKFRMRGEKKKCSSIHLTDGNV